MRGLSSGAESSSTVELLRERPAIMDSSLDKTLTSDDIIGVKNAKKGRKSDQPLMAHGAPARDREYSHTKDPCPMK